MAVIRVGVSFEPELLARFDELIERKGYSSRSEAIRDLIRSALIKDDVESGEGEVVGTITILYRHDEGDVVERLMHIQHHHHQEIKSTAHIHVDEHVCLEVLVVRGDGSHLRELADNLRAIKGVRYGDLVVARPDI